MTIRSAVWPCPYCRDTLRGFPPTCPHCGGSLEPNDLALLDGRHRRAVPVAALFHPRAGMSPRMIRRAAKARAEQLARMAQQLRSESRDAADRIARENGIETREFLAYLLSHGVQI